MSDIANPRVENYYMHPKKYAWRADSKLLSPEKIKVAEEESKISEVIKERFKMVINSNYKTESIEESEMSLTIELPSPNKNQVSQDAPIDFSVKTIVHTEHAHHSEFESSHSSIKEDGKMSHHPDFSSNYPNIKKSMAVPIYSGKVTSSVPNGSSKYQRPKLRHMNGSTQEYLEYKHEIRSATQDTSTYHRNTIEFSQFANSNHRRREMNDESFECDESNSQGQSSNLSRDNSPEAMSCSGSILQDVIVRHPDQRSPLNGVGSYVQTSSPSASCSKPFQGTMSPFFGTSPILPDTGSLLPTVGLIPASTTMANYALLNGFGCPMPQINGMNLFSNGSLPSTSMDTKMFQTSGLCDKKQNKPMRPFKAMTNDMMFGIHPILPPVTGVMPNSGFFKDYFQGSAKEITEPPKNNSVSKKESSEASASSAINTSPSTSSNGTEQKPDVAGSGDSNSSFQDASGSAIETAESTSNGSNNKRSRTLPIEVKDDAYWERRRKNNQAAKRSRDARRQKEDLVAQQAWLFREYNQQLSNHIKGLDAQNRQLQLQNHAALEQCRNLELQLRLANEKLTHTRCGKCGSRLRSDNCENSFGNSNANE